MSNKGIVLAGGKGTRLYPSSIVNSKQLLPVYNKPMIYYSLSTLMLAGVKDILIISSNEHLPIYKNLFGDGSKLGILINYETQEEANGIAEALKIGKKFIGDSNVYLILGDNIFYGSGMQDYFNKINDDGEYAYVFGTYVSNPMNFGIISYKDNKFLIEEKPSDPKSNIAVTGLYYYPNKSLKYVDELAPSARNELEITDLNNILISKDMLKLIEFGRGYAWFDCGNPSSLLEASTFIRTVENIQGIKIGCIEEIALRKGFISNSQLEEIIENLPKSEYKDYLNTILV